MRDRITEFLSFITDLVIISPFLIFEVISILTMYLLCIPYFIKEGVRKWIKNRQY